MCYPELGPGTVGMLEGQTAAHAGNSPRCREMGREEAALDVGLKPVPGKIKSPWFEGVSS